MMPAGFETVTAGEIILNGRAITRVPPLIAIITASVPES
jgi:ABC-type Fe3+/spermidine/putrescine transport system ATPase subunit